MSMGISKGSCLKVVLNKDEACMNYFHRIRGSTWSQ